MSEPLPTASSDPLPMRFFEGFEWAVPTAFAAALASFRFEQGDVLYREAAAYDGQANASETGGSALQILLPKRSQRALPTEAEGGRRAALWESPVVLERVQLEAGKSETLQVTQGRLLMTLWTGDEGWLDDDREAPIVPLAGRDLAGRLEESLGTIAPKFTSTKGARFLFVVDLASDASRAKAQSIEDALGPLGAVERVELPAARSGVSDAERFHPALVIRGLAIGGASVDDVQAALRGALYGGSAHAKTDAETDVEGEAKADRFSVARHGLLAPLGPDAVEPTGDASA